MIGFSLLGDKTFVIIGAVDAVDRCDPACSTRSGWLLPAVGFAA
jgi:hypothetical protein